MIKRQDKLTRKWMLVAGWHLWSDRQVGHLFQLWTPSPCSPQYLHRPAKTMEIIEFLINSPSDKTQNFMHNNRWTKYTDWVQQLSSYMSEWWQLKLFYWKTPWQMSAINSSSSSLVVVSTFHSQFIRHKNQCLFIDSNGIICSGH